MVFVVLAALSLSFTPAEFPTFHVVGVVVVVVVVSTTGSGAGCSAPNSYKQSKKKFKVMILFSYLNNLSNEKKENDSRTIHSTF